MSHLTSLLYSAAFGLALSGSLASAQTGEPSEATSKDTTLETITVTGQYLYSDQINALKAPTPIIDVPQSLSIISSEHIQKRGFDSVADIVNYTPGVNMSQGEGHRDTVIFRGVRSTADFFVDGIRDDVQYYRPLYNLEQVEILRGPNALLFGRGGAGGVLNRVTKKGQIGERFTGYSAAIDSFGGYELAVDKNVTTGDSSAVRINAFYEHMQNHRNFFDGDNIGLNPTAKLVFAPGTTLDLSYEFADHERFIDRGIPTGSDGKPVEAFKDIVFGDPELNTAEFTAHILRANLQHQFNDTVKGNITASYGDYDKLYQNFYASGYDQTNTPDRVTLDGYVDTTQRRRMMLAGNLVGEFDTGGLSHTLIAGTELIYTSNNNDRYNARWSSNGFTDDNDTFLIADRLNLAGGSGVNADGIVTTNDFTRNLNDKRQADLKVYSLYIQDQIEVGDNLDILIGGRFDSFDINVDDLKARSSSGRLDQEFSPRLGLVYKPKENISVYASYSETFLPSSGGQYASAGNLDPDVFEQAEIGVKWDFLDALSLTAAYFQNDEKAAGIDPNTEESIEERGLEVSGFEVQLQGNITDKWFISSGYSYLEGETDKGREIPRELPENMFSIYTSYDVTDSFGLGIGATYQSDSFITDFGIGSDASTHPTLPAFTRVDASAYYDVSDKLRLQFNIENLTDEVYFPTAHSTHQATVGEPLNARIGIIGKF